MSSTNKTTNYELSQYVGSDKPTYLGDYNGDMLKIDTQMKANATAIQSASAGVETANTNASTALSKANEAKTTADEAQTSANSASSLASTANVNAQSALNQISNFNLSSIETITNITTTVGSIDSTGSSIKVAKNTDGSIAKIYGTIKVTLNGNTSPFTVSFPTSLRPSSNITFDNTVITRLTDPSYNIRYMSVRSMSLDTNGVVTISHSGNSASMEDFIYLIPVLLFIKDFGDTGSSD